MTDLTFLSGKVRKHPLPAFENPAISGTALLKRLMLPQGELAQFHNGDPPIHYLAFIELRQGSIRGNHFHKVKEEFIYMLQGEMVLVVENTGSKQRESVPMQTGDLVIIETSVAHALRVLKSGQAVEYSQSRFDAADIYRYPLIET